MEKHIQIFCKQNPNIELECQKCHTKTKIKTLDFLKNKYTYEFKCDKCNSTTSFDTKDFFEKLEPFKKLV